MVKCRPAAPRVAMGMAWWMQRSLHRRFLGLFGCFGFRAGTAHHMSAKIARALATGLRFMGKDDERL